MNILKKEDLKKLLFSGEKIYLNLTSIKELDELFNFLVTKNINYEDLVYIKLDITNLNKEEIENFIKVCNNFYFHLILLSDNKEKLKEIIKKIILLEKKALNLEGQEKETDSNLDIELRIIIVPLNNIIESFFMEDIKIYYNSIPELNKNYKYEEFLDYCNYCKSLFTKGELKKLEEIKNNFVNNLILVNKLEKGLI